MSGGVGPAELEPVAPVGADHMLSGEDETGPERGEEAGGGVLWHLCVGSLRLGVVLDGGYTCDLGIRKPPVPTDSPREVIGNCFRALSEKLLF